ncbi:hypothetical protein EON79_08390 [bacterium]|nr:MAG: hypothetical protein EON79_08390 [bacterium]
MASDLLPPKLRQAPSPFALLSGEAGLELSEGHRGEIGNYGPTTRFEVTIDGVEVAKIEYPSNGYPALLITGQQPFWRYNTVYSPEELKERFRDEVARDPRFLPNQTEPSI